MLVYNVLPLFLYLFVCLLFLFTTVLLPHPCINLLLLCIILFFEPLPDLLGVRPEALSCESLREQAAHWLLQQSFRQSGYDGKQAPDLVLQSGLASCNGILSKTGGGIV